MIFGFPLLNSVILSLYSQITPKLPIPPLTANHKSSFDSLVIISISEFGLTIVNSSILSIANPRYLSSYPCPHNWINPPIPVPYYVPLVTAFPGQCFAMNADRSQFKQPA